MPLARYREWKRRNADIGCTFARVMAVAPDRYGYLDELVSGTNPAQVAAAIASCTAAAIGDPAVNALAVVLPDIIDLRTLVGIANELGATPSWSRALRLLHGTPIGDAVAFGLTREIPFNGAACPSEVLMLGNFPGVFPTTRCAPVTALEIYVGAPPPIDFMGKPTSKGHLALVNMPMPPMIMQKAAQATASARIASLGGVDDPRAKAKVSFCIPLPLAQALGCVPP